MGLSTKHIAHLFTLHKKDGLRGYKSSTLMVGCKPNCGSKSNSNVPLPNYLVILQLGHDGMEKTPMHSFLLFF